MNKPIVISLLCLLAFIIFILQASAQSPDSLWSQTFGGDTTEVCSHVEQTSDGGYMLAGYTMSFGGGKNFWLVKTNANGDSLWSRSYNETADDVCNSAQQTSDGGYILAGYCDIMGNGVKSGLVIKTNSSGGSQWSNAYMGGDGISINSIQQTSDGGYATAGYVIPLGSNANFYLIKLTSSGSYDWAGQYGGSDNDYCQSIQQTSDGGYILAGRTDSYGAGLADFWLVKTDTSGTMLWNRTFGGWSHERCFSVIQTSDGGYALGGSTESFGAGWEDFWLVKTNANGDSLWSSTFGGSNYDRCYSIQQTWDSGYIMAGYTESYGSGGRDFWLVKTDSLGNYEWDLTFGGSGADLCRSVQETPDKGFTLAGYTDSYGVGDKDFWLLKAEYHNPPNITSITDVGNDQGRLVRLRWDRCIYDGFLPDYTITAYNIYRRIDEYRDNNADIAAREGLDWPPGEWEYILTVPARGETEYATAAPTLADSTSEGIYWSVFFVSAETPDPLTFFDSEVDSGYSIDNLPPDLTRVVAMIQPAPNQILLRWDEVTTGGGGQPEQGGIWYRVYGSTDPNFTPGPGNLLTVTENLEFLHNIGTNYKYFYKIKVSDDH